VGVLVAMLWVGMTVGPIGAAARDLSSVDGGSISGMVWWDRNANNMWELDEIVVVGWPVYLRAEADGPDGPIQQRITDGDGVYIFSELAYGFYDLWSEDHRGDTPHQRIEVNEVGAPVSLDLGVAGWQLFVPMYYKSDAPLPPFRVQ